MAAAGVSGKENVRTLVPRRFGAGPESRPDKKSCQFFRSDLVPGQGGGQTKGGQTCVQPTGRYINRPADSWNAHSTPTAHGLLSRAQLAGEKKKNEIGLTGSRRCAIANRIPNLHNFWTQVILLTLVAVAAAGELHPIAILKQNIETQLDGSYQHG